MMTQLTARTLAASAHDPAQIRSADDVHPMTLHAATAPKPHCDSTPSSQHARTHCLAYSVNAVVAQDRHLHCGNRTVMPTNAMLCRQIPCDTCVSPIL
eukprot:10114228-Lingulodinium_polyedra.AAC.1